MDAVLGSDREELSKWQVCYLLYLGTTQFPGNSHDHRQKVETMEKWEAVRQMMGWAKERIAVKYANFYGVSIFIQGNTRRKERNADYDELYESKKTLLPPLSTDELDSMAKELGYPIPEDVYEYLLNCSEEIPVSDYSQTVFVPSSRKTLKVGDKGCSYSIELFFEGEYAGKVCECDEGSPIRVGWNSFESYLFSCLCRKLLSS